jgi:uncharacterized membrane protein (DUF373 family)
MISVLFAIAAFMAIITAFILNSMSKTKKYKTLYKVLVVLVSLSIYIVVAVYLFQQKSL